MTRAPTSAAAAATLRPPTTFTRKHVSRSVSHTGRLWKAVVLITTSGLCSRTTAATASASVTSASSRVTPASAMAGSFHSRTMSEPSCPLAPKRRTFIRCSPPAGDTAALHQQVLQLHLPLKRLAAPRRRVGHLFVDGLAPANVLFFFQQDVVEDAHGGRVRNLVRDLRVVAVVHGEVRLQDAVEADNPQKLLCLQL